MAVVSFFHRVKRFVVSCYVSVEGTNDVDAPLWHSMGAFGMITNYNITSILPKIIDSLSFGFFIA